jgi:small conductance mechanosensitive channel
MTGVSLDQIMPALLALSVAIGQAVLRIALILVIGVVAIRLAYRVLGRLTAVFERAGRATEDLSGASEKRAETLSGILKTIIVTSVWTIVVILSLSQVGLDITPILAGAGILGLAVGFGAQNLVRDVISGFFLVLEDQVRVGDVAKVNGTGGLVEAVTFRTVTLRDLDGTVHMFPNGTITTLSNLTHGWSAYVIDVGVAYQEDTDRVVGVMRQVDEQLRADPAFAPKMLEPIEILGVDNFADSAVVIKARLKTVLIEQWNVGREYRRRLKKAFDAQGIEFPFPHRALYMSDASVPFKVQVLAESPALARTGRA